MSYQKNLHTNRIAEVDNQNGWTHVTLNSRFYPARYKFSMDSGIYSVACVEIAPRDRGAGRSAIVVKPDVLHFRNATVDGLREEITKSFPQAIFSNSEPQQADPIRAAYQEQRENQPADAKEVEAAREKLRKQYGVRDDHGRQFLVPGEEISWDMCQKIGIRKAVFEALGQAEQQNYVDGVIRQHKILSEEMTKEEQAKHIGSSLNSFMLGEIWGSWFRNYPNNFFSYPNNQYKNRDTILKYCADQGFQIPIHGVLDEAMRFLLDHKMFYLQSSYKRSEKYEMDAVRQYSGVENAPPTFSPAQIQEATQRLRKALPVGSVPSQERILGTARELGISQELLYAIQNPGQQAKAQVGNKSSAELKRDLQAMRPPVKPADYRKGY